MRPTHLIMICCIVFLQCSKNGEETKVYPQSPSYINNSSPGTSAKDFLRNTNYNSLRIEMQYMPGSKPDPLAIDILTTMLRERLNKPSGIFIELKEINPTLQTIFSEDDISDLESLNRTVYTSGDQLCTYIILVNGSYIDGNALALAYHNTSMCVFGEPLQYFSAGFTDNVKAKVLGVLLMHEFGHLMGLVDMGSKMVGEHSDPQNPNHCRNNNCLMHNTYTTNTRYAVAELDQIPTFDNACLADLRANGGK